MHKKIKKWIIDYVQEESSRENLKNLWKEPIISFVDAEDLGFQDLKVLISGNHYLPTDLMEDATAVIAYFIPFTEALSSTNFRGKYSSREWAMAYLKTNELIGRINAMVHQSLNEYGFSVSEIPATRNFDQEKLISDWSHRHVAYIAGLGKFGLNNLLITEKGCCGRIGTFVTNAQIDKNLLTVDRNTNENCLYKVHQSCTKCVDRCVNGSLTIDVFDRNRCYELLLYNDRLHHMNGLGEVCGKCNVALPCSHHNPINKFNHKKRRFGKKSKMFHNI